MKTKQSIKFTEDHGHNKDLAKRYNRITKFFDVTELPQLLMNWMDDTDLESFIQMLEERHLINCKQYVIEYNVRSRCERKAYSATIIENVDKEFGMDTFDDMIGNSKHELKDDGSIYYLEQDLEGRRAQEGNQDVIYDRAWVISPKKPNDFLRYLEARL